MAWTNVCCDVAIYIFILFIFFIFKLKVLQVSLMINFWINMFIK